MTIILMSETLPNGVEVHLALDEMTKTFSVFVKSHVNFTEDYFTKYDDAHRCYLAKLPEELTRLDLDFDFEDEEIDEENIVAYAGPYVANEDDYHAILQERNEQLLQRLYEQEAAY